MPVDPKSWGQFLPVPIVAAPMATGSDEHDVNEKGDFASYRPCTYGISIDGLQRASKQSRCPTHTKARPAGRFANKQ